MDFQKLADAFYAPTAVLSVETTPDGGYSTIRIVAGNQKYISPIIRPVNSPTPGLEGTKLLEFIPDSPYENYLPKDKGFEELCFRCAVQKVPIHTYVHINIMNVWFDIYVQPVDYEDGARCYCTYTANMCSADEVGLTSSNFGSISEDVLKTCIKLHETEDFHQTMHEVIKDIRMVCRAEVCTIILLDNTNESYSVLATDSEKQSTIRKVTELPDFYHVAASWVSMLGENDCIILKKNENDMNYIKELNDFCYQFMSESDIDRIAIFPLRHNNEVLGFIWAVNFDVSNTMRIKETLELTTFFVSAQIASYRMMERLKKLSYSDILTELPTRFACTDKIAELVRKGEPFVVVSIDLNHFKSINDTLGFDSGNNVLIRIAKRWKRLAESHLTATEDFIARISGDEFALIIRGYHSEEDILHTIRQYETAVEKRLTIDECDLHMTAGFGYAEYPADADSADTLMSCAIAAMREVKRINSSNHIVRFYSDLLKSERTLEIEQKIRDALEHETLYYHLQPQFDMHHKLRGFEALARMKDADGTFISPGEFIPVAEKVGLVDKVDGMVFRKAAMFFGELLRKTGADITLSVNVSVRHLMKNDFFDEICSVLKSSGVPANRLEIEITESIMIDSVDKALKCIDQLKAMGILIAIDDFGTGYSSLSYLNRFPANLLKVDKSFIDKMNTSESSRQYVSAIISIGHIMGFDVISEGVEDAGQVETLRKIGCDFIQGFVWGRPLMPEAAETLVQQSVNNKEEF